MSIDPRRIGRRLIIAWQAWLRPADQTRPSFRRAYRSDVTGGCSTDIFYNSGVNRLLASGLFGEAAPAGGPVLAWLMQFKQVLRGEREAAAGLSYGFVVVCLTLATAACVAGDAVGAVAGLA